MSTHVEIPFGGKKRPFRLALGELQELQGVCNVGPSTILGRLVSYQPQAATFKRPQPDAYDLGASDPDFIADFNTYSILRSIGGDWRVEEVRETIRLGLIGAGMTSTDAFILVSTYVDQTDKHPLTDNVGIAATILVHALTAPVGEDVGKPVTEKARRKKATA